MPKPAGSRGPSREDDEVPFGYQFEYTVHSHRIYSLPEAEDDEDIYGWITHVDGKIIYRDAVNVDPDLPVEIGKTSAQVIRLPDAEEAGEPIFDVFDAESEELAEIFNAVFD